jgi:hypothetical protein
VWVRVSVLFVKKKASTREYVRSQSSESHEDNIHIILKNEGNIYGARLIL